jgi:putative endopeptidase
MNTVLRLLYLAALALASASGALAQTQTAGLDPANFDSSVRPQDDFYRYVNGGWLDRTAIPSDRARWGTFDDLREKALGEVRAILEPAPAAGLVADPDQAKLQAFYKSYMDEPLAEQKGLAPLRADLARIDALKSKAGVVAEFGWQDHTGSTSPIDFAIHQDNRNSTRYIVDLVQSGLGLPDRDYYLKDDAKLKEARGKYHDYIATTLALAGDKNAAAEADAILALETRIAQVQWTKVENRDPVKTYNKMATADLGKLTAQIDWKRFLDSVGVGAKISDLTVSQPTYVTALGKIVDETSLADWKSYLRWRLIDDSAPLLSKAFVDAHFAFHGTAVRGIPANQDRWKRAVQAVQLGMGEAVGRQYVGRNFPASAKARADELVKNVLAAFRTGIDQLDWMSPATKAEAQAKLAKFMPKIGYPKKWRDYSKLEIRADDLYGNVRRAAVFESERNIGKLGGPIDRDEWGMTPQTVNAYYNPELNEIVFPAAILQPPFFQADADDAANYGGIGAVIGHEISHGFDDQGAQYDGDGNLRDWWTATDHEHFSAKTHALAAQYSGYEPVKGYFLNGELTLGENIGDNSGIAVAYRAYHIALGGQPAPVIAGMTGDQRFFASFATVWRGKARESETIRLIKIDPHSSPPFRARGTLSNQDPFFAAFDIKPGDPWYTPPDKRIHIW